MEAVVVIPTHRPGELLRRVVDATHGQRRPDDCHLRIVVVENGSSDASTLLAGSPATLISLVGPNASHARNVGAMAQGCPDVVVFLDDDVVPQQGWLCTLIGPIIAGDCDATTGAIVVRTESAITDAVRGCFVDTALAMDPDAPFLAGGNMAMRGRRFSALGGFDVRLGPGTRPGGGEDLLLGMQLAEAGGRVAWIPEAVVEHVVPPTRLTNQALRRRAAVEGRAAAWLAHHHHHAQARWGLARVIRSALLRIVALLGPAGSRLERQMVADARWNRDIDLLRYRYPVLGHSADSRRF